MATCVLDAKGYCERHKEVHVGARVALSQDPSPKGEQARELWDKILAGFRPGQAVQVHAGPAGGPGTELHAILQGIGVIEKPNCGCRAMMARMDNWGVAGTRAHAAEVADFMRTNAEKFGWVERLKAMANAALTGLALKINWLNPWPDLVEMACVQAEAKLAGAAVAPVTVSAAPAAQEKQV